jgi:glycosyltransferase involved in cell wall biosynthesis
MRLLFVSDYHVPQKHRGTEVSTHAFCRTLGAAGHAPSVACRFTPSGLLGLQGRARMRVSGRQWARDHAAGYPTHRAWNVARSLASIVKEARPDAVVLQSADYDAMLALLEQPVPVVHLFRFIPDWPDLPLRGRAVHVANSLFCQRRIEEVFGVASTVIRPMVVPEDYRTHVRPREVTGFGLSWDKGADIVVSLAEALPDIPFRIFANEPVDRLRGRDIAARARRLRNLRVTPPRPSSGRIYARSRLVIAPSRWEETWGRIATEAHVNGIPVLASDRGGLPEAVGAGGICLSPEAPLSEWREALLTLFRDDAAYARYRLAARDRAAASELSPAILCRDLLQAAEAAIAKAA